MEQAVSRLSPALLEECIGEPLSVLVQASHYDSRIQAEIFGYVRGGYVALHSPGRRHNAGLSALLLRVGDEVAVRFLHDGTAYGFASEVIHLTTRPDALVFLQYPRELAQVSVRHHRRLKCRLPCNLVSAGGELAPAVLLDISEGGMKIASKAFGQSDQELSTSIKVELTLPSTAGGVTLLEGEIIRTEGQPQAVVAGIKFETRQTDLINHLAEFLYLDETYSRQNDALTEGI